MILWIAWACLQAPPVVSPGGEVAARVNDEYIFWWEVDARLKLSGGTMDAELLKARRAKLVNMVEERLFLQAAARHKITVTDEEVDDRIRRQIKAARNEEAFDAWLRTSGLTRTEHREEWRRTLLIYKLCRFLFSKSFFTSDGETPDVMHDMISPVEVREYYLANRDRFKAIEYVAVTWVALQFSTDKEKAQKRALAESILRKLEEGSDFHFLASLYSELRRLQPDGSRLPRDRSLKRDNGFHTASTNALLFDTMKVGDTSPVVEDGRAFWIFQLEDRVSRKAETFEDAQGRVRNELEARKREANRLLLRGELVRRGHIEPPDLFNEK